MKPESEDTSLSDFFAEIVLGGTLCIGVLAGLAFLRSMSRMTAILLVVGLSLVAAVVVFRVMRVLDHVLGRRRPVIVTAIAAVLTAGVLGTILLMYCGCA